MKIEEDPRRRGTTSVRVTMSWGPKGCCGPWCGGVVGRRGGGGGVVRWPVESMRVWKEKQI